MLKVLRFLVCSAALVAYFMPGSAAAAAAAPLVSKASGLCLDVVGDSTTPGALVQISTCHNGPNQLWESTAAGELRTLGGPVASTRPGRRPPPERP